MITFNLYALNKAIDPDSEYFNTKFAESEFSVEIYRNKEDRPCSPTRRYTAGLTF